MKHFQQYKVGVIMGSNDVIFMKETNPIPRKCGRVHRTADFQCSCGKFFNALINAVKGDHTTSCGCLKTKHIIESVRTHGLYKHPLYGVWSNIKERTTNKNYKHYKNYGARGITMFPPWQVDFQLFHDYVTALPNYGEKGLTLDRTDNDGNYEPGNLRWATRHTQNINSRKRGDNSSGYIGVYKSRNYWSSRIGGNTYIGQFKTKEQGVIARNNYIIANNLTEYKIQSILSE